MQRGVENEIILAMKERERERERDVVFPSERLHRDITREESKKHHAQRKKYTCIFTSYAFLYSLKVCVFYAAVSELHSSSVVPKE
jgi:hypothetical protein